MKVKSTGEKLTLAKDKPQILRNGDLLGLLPDSLYFRVVYKGQDNGEVETRYIFVQDWSCTEL